jgi:hypothetical protein
MEADRAASATATSILSGVVLTVSGLSHGVKMGIKDRIVALGGHYSDHLSQGTTHVLAENTGTEKYRAAIRMGDVEVVTQDWLAECERAGSRAVESKFRVPVFRGVRASITGFSRERRESLAAVIQDNGGIYSGTMEYNVTTHLIAEKAEGNKYEAVLDWGSDWTVQVVRAAWVSESMKQGVRLPEENFLLPDAIPHSQTATVPSQPTALTPTQMTQRANVSTPSTYQPSMSTQQQLSMSSSSTPSSRPARSDEEFRDAISKVAENDSLGHCRMLLVGFPEARQRLLIQAIYLGGASRCCFPNGVVTHVVMGDRKLVDPQWMTALSAHLCRPEFVDEEWILGSLTAGTTLPVKPLPEEDYSGSSSQQREKPKRWPSGSQRDQNEKIFAGNIVVLPGSGLDAERREALARMACGAGALVLKKDDLRRGAQAIQEKLNELGKEGSCYAIVGHGSVQLDGKHDLGGIACEPAIAVLRTRQLKVVSEIWFQSCLVDQKLYDPTDFRWFEPQPMPLCPFPPSTSMCLTFSGFEGALFRGLKELCRAMGGEGSHDMRRTNTHLVTDRPTGLKVKHAPEFGLHVVTSEWLLHCASRGYQKGCESEFSLDLHREVEAAVGASSPLKENVCHVQEGGRDNGSGTERDESSPANLPSPTPKQQTPTQMTQGQETHVRVLMAKYEDPPQAHKRTYLPLMQGEEPQPRRSKTKKELALALEVNGELGNQHFSQGLSQPQAESQVVGYPSSIPHEKDGLLLK